MRHTLEKNNILAWVLDLYGWLLCTVDLFARFVYFAKSIFFFDYILEKQAIHKKLKAEACNLVRKVIPGN